MNIDLRLGDCLEVLKTIPDNSIDAVITDPPYGLGFMNKEWDSPEKLRQLTQREADRSAERKAEGKSPTDAPFSKSVPPGLAIKGAKEGKWFQEWCELWAAECLRILKPGGHILSFSAPRTYHRMATAFEDAGFEIRDQLMWVFGSGFPKSHNIGKAIDKLEGNEREVLGISDNTRDRNKHEYNSVGNFGSKKIVDTKGNSEWEGWGTALKPAHEPIVMARKPLSEKSIAENVLKHGTGGINIDGSRIGYSENDDPRIGKGYAWDSKAEPFGEAKTTQEKEGWNNEGRFPANIIFDEEAGQLLDEQSGIGKGQKNPKVQKGSKRYGENQFTNGGMLVKDGWVSSTYNDMGGASRFFYCPKASKKDRNEGLDNFTPKTDRQKGHGLDRICGICGTSMLKPQDCKCEEPDWITPPKLNHHPTVKPTDLMRYLINLITPSNGVVLDPFMGSGSTGKAAVRCGVNFIGIEKEQEYMDIAKARIEHEKNKPVQGKLL
jgi:site-specific DNA-methyltransferase (adenine-specific)